MDHIKIGYLKSYGNFGFRACSNEENRRGWGETMGTIKANEPMTRDDYVKLALQRLVCDHMPRNGECVKCGETDQEQLQQ